MNELFTQIQNIFQIIGFSGLADLMQDCIDESDPQTKLCDMGFNDICDEMEQWCQDFTDDFLENTGIPQEDRRNRMIELWDIVVKASDIKNISKCSSYSYHSHENEYTIILNANVPDTARATISDKILFSSPDEKERDKEYRILKDKLRLTGIVIK